MYVYLFSLKETTELNPETGIKKQTISNLGALHNYQYLVIAHGLITAHCRAHSAPTGTSQAPNESEQEESLM
jgi:hypothetical protein